MNRQLLTAVVLGVLVPAGCATVPNTDRYVAPPQGSTWTNAVQTSGSFGSGNRQAKTTMGMQTWQGRSLLAFQSDPFTVIAEQDGCWVAQLRGTTPLFSWDPPICANRPFIVGETSTKKFHVMVHETKQSIDIEGRWKVEAYEEINVPAGRFAAFKITYSDNVGNERTDWSSPELGVFVKSSVRRNTQHRLGAGTIESELVSHTITR